MTPLNLDAPALRGIQSAALADALREVYRQAVNEAVRVALTQIERGFTDGWGMTDAETSCEEGMDIMVSIMRDRAAEFLESSESET